MQITNKDLFHWINLTLTSVVFEYDINAYDVRNSPHLTLTSVVFEFYLNTFAVLFLYI